MQSPSKYSPRPCYEPAGARKNTVALEQICMEDPEREDDKSNQEILQPGGKFAWMTQREGKKNN